MAKLKVRRAGLGFSSRPTSRGSCKPWRAESDATETAKVESPPSEPNGVASVRLAASASGSASTCLGEGEGEGEGVGEGVGEGEGDSQGGEKGSAQGEGEGFSSG